MRERRGVESCFQVVRGSETRNGIASVLPPGLVASVAFGDVEPDRLFPEEVALIGSAVEARKLEFARGRSCARRAIAQFDVVPQPILADAKRAPLWPSGLTGSISHCHGYCCAVVGRSAEWAGIGVDVELLRVLEDGVQQLILTPTERGQLQGLDPSTPWACVVFAIKEAIYKLWSPVTGSWLGFEDAVVTLDPGRARFEAELRSGASTRLPSWLRRLEGRFCLDVPYVMAAIAVAMSTTAER